MFALCNPNMTGLLQGNTPKFGPKVTHPLLVWASETLDRKLRPNGYWIQIAQLSQWKAYRKLPSLFLMVSSLTPYDLPFPQNRRSICPQYTRMAISLQRVIWSTSCLVLWTADRTALFTIRTNQRWRPPPWWKNFKWRYLRNWSSDPLHVLF